MKFKIVAAACAAICSASVFAVPLDPVTQVPDLTFYIGGATAQAQGLGIVVPADLFATPADVIKVTQPTGQKATAWYGMSNAAQTGGVSKKLLVIYNNTNGSAAGLSQLVSPGTTEAEANVVTVGNAGCSAVSGSAGSYTATCSNSAPTEIDMALTDVGPSELVPGVVTFGGGNLTVSQLNVNKTALQGFGVVVNPALYQALQDAQGLPVTCHGSLTADCQPSIRRADYASLVTGEGSIKDASALLGLAPGTNTTDLTIVRRVNSSGTQASSNIFFANNICGLKGYGGSKTPLGAVDAPYPNPYAPGFIIAFQEQSGTGGVKTALTGTTTPGYAIGVISLENAAVASASSWQYVKVDGISPNFLPNGTVDATQRYNFAAGSYPLAFEMYAEYRNTAPATTVALATAVINGLKDSTRHNLTGVAYLDGTADVTKGGKAARVNRGGNNCAPLMN